MKIFPKFRKISAKNGEGSVKLQAIEEEDIYHLYNLITIGDLLKGSTTRNVVTTSLSGTTHKDRKRIEITLCVEEVDFDMEQCTLRVKGRNMAENEFMKMGQYHTVDIEVGQPITLEKQCWDTISLERLTEASDPAAKADMAAIVMQEGLAHVCLVTSSMTVTRSRIERRMPKKGQVEHIDHVTFKRLSVCDPI